MCGICGIVRIGAPPEREVVERMTERLAHRGPDDAGVVGLPGAALGSRRLAIIDLSADGHQPFSTDDGRLHIVHNGEIYNYRELRAELEQRGRRFRSATDTEVVLRAYEEWGDACTSRFNGMWAFAIWDAEKGELFASRDRLGEKPFYYRFSGDRLVFASEPKAFRLDPETHLRPNPRVCRDYLELGYVEHTDETFFDGIVKLPAAHSLRFGRDGLTVGRYWRLEQRELPAADRAEEVRSLFLDAVRLRLRSDVRVGTALSGGLDSSAVVCAVDHLRRTETDSAAAVGEKQATFTAFFEGRGRLDERPYAQAVVDATAVEPHWVTFTPEEALDALPAIVGAQDEPFASTSMVAQWFVMRAAARAGVKVMLDGQGGDETLAGYPVYAGYRFADLLAERRLRELAAEIASYRGAHGTSGGAIAAGLLRPFLGAGLKRRFRTRAAGTEELAGSEIRGPVTARPADEGDFADRLHSQLHLILTRQGLPALLRYEDRNSMTHSVEARLPFLDYRLVELLFSLDGGELIRRGRTKDVLRKALGDLLPATVRDRVDKVGFETPEAEWFRGPFGDLAADTFASRSFADRGLVDPAAARELLKRHRDGTPARGYQLWRALNLELWAREAFDGTGSSL